MNRLKVTSEEVQEVRDYIRTLETLLRENGFRPNRTTSSVIGVFSTGWRYRHSEAADSALATARREAANAGEVKALNDLIRFAGLDAYTHEDGYPLGEVLRSDMQRVTELQKIKGQDDRASGRLREAKLL